MSHYFGVEWFGLERNRAHFNNLPDAIFGFVAESDI